MVISFIFKALVLLFCHSSTEKYKTDCVVTQAAFNALQQKVRKLNEFCNKMTDSIHKSITFQMVCKLEEWENWTITLMFIWMHVIVYLYTWLYPIDPPKKSDSLVQYRRDARYKSDADYFSWHQSRSPCSPSSSAPSPSFPPWSGRPSPRTPPRMGSLARSASTRCIVLGQSVSNLSKPDKLQLVMLSFLQHITIKPFPGSWSTMVGRRWQATWLRTTAPPLMSTPRTARRTWPATTRTWSTLLSTGGSDYPGMGGSDYPNHGGNPPQQVHCWGARCRPHVPVYGRLQACA